MATSTQVIGRVAQRLRLLAMSARAPNSQAMRTAMA